MNRRFASVCVILGLIALIEPRQISAEIKEKVETVGLSDIESGAAKFDGQVRSATMEEEDAPKEKLFQQYGTRTFTLFEKHPEIVAALRKLNPKFNPHTMGTSDLNSIVTIQGKTLLISIGCFPHNCHGTHQLVAFEPATKRVYLLQPTNLGPDSTPSGKFYLYGNPDSSVRAAMYDAYPR